MMPFSKEQNRRIYITALVISFLLIVGSIYLHLRQKTHLGRMSFHLDSDRIEPTSGVETSTWTSDKDYDYDLTTTRTKNHEAKSTTIQPNNESDEYGKSSSEEISSDESKSSSSQEKSVLTYSKSNPIDEDIESEMLHNDYETACLHCLCMTINECKLSFCKSRPCGKYMISQLYWSDAGKPKVNYRAPYISDETDYIKCANNDNYSKRAVVQYFQRYKRDCNKDDVIDCKDQIALHLLGPSGCLRQNISQKHEIRMNKCITSNNIFYFDSSFEAEMEENYY